MNAARIADPVHSKALPDLVAKLLAARQESLVLYHRLAALKPFLLMEPAQHLLRRFQEVLVDYLALGLFEVYRTLDEQPGHSPYCQARDLARRLYGHIAHTTHAAMLFHDRYEGELSDPVWANLDSELSRLGEQLAVRIELEDRIVAAIRGSDATLAA
ncbi:MAG TPA: Rsd/AlgQ family anti-sigma factor [Candidatus Competibacteraceae bacterium]|nr:MAG: Rsd/AlgQ family anti-sigma factor [Candidatus Competibacteraceae bacterium]HOB61513.1 Rsd/AlgQ family anti-sigma factor [Candidatus Competibacteraceae bacterium]HQA25026.1 Rsd/AlgQ family anti-sigma factor [Candidatus Competibacteraceae bacterium]HQD55955.1 Rsd/AlgQ family anti-sigma factor [Candidatus Competibacteraceae bacterium]